TYALAGLPQPPVVTHLTNADRAALGWAPVPPWPPVEEVDAEPTEAELSAARACATTFSVIAEHAASLYDRETPPDEWVGLRGWRLGGRLPSGASVMLRAIRVRGASRAARPAAVRVRRTRSCARAPDREPPGRSRLARRGRRWL